ncbi:MAG: hypothetical protein Q9160_002880 [Pyrenula sp. 1 TL-2023]
MSTSPYPIVVSAEDDLLTMDDVFRNFGDLDDLKDPNATPKGFQDNWRFTPSLMDPNSFAFSTFANQPPGYYTPTPGGVNTLYHNQAGDLHTPGMGMNTPLSLPQSIHNLSATDPTFDLNQLHPSQHLVPSHIYHSNIPYGQQPSFAPSQFLNHEDSGYIEQSPHKSPPQNVDVGMLPPGHTHSFARPSANGITATQMSMGEKYAINLDPCHADADRYRFRYHVTLNAPTAMVKHADEIPVTYLNKGQAYTVSIIDTAPLPPNAGPIKYRTFVRISFEDEQQRSKPGACWQLWKEGRGTNEAHQRGGKLQAVEHVELNQGGDDETRKPQVEIESASFDGFCVTWTPTLSSGTADCQISVRFNFLSTDFSHSKGVKGIPVRLCAKTEMIMPGSDTQLDESEVCYCKVKLFRDHGAERKLSNDIAHVKKTIEKLKQQITQAESGMGPFGKRKRSGSMAKLPTSGRPGKVLKHKRTWSMDSEGETSGRITAEEDLHIKLVTMQDMFSSTRPASLLYLKGQEQDDPDLFPVQLIGGDIAIPKTLVRQDTMDSKPSAGDITPSTTNMVSPSPSSPSTVSVCQGSAERKQTMSSQSASSQPSRHASGDWQQQPQDLGPTKPIKIRKIQTDSSAGWIEALEVDTSYQPPPEPPIRPVACFFIQISHAGQQPSDSYYRAIYLMQRTVKDLSNAIAEKAGIDAGNVTRVLRQHPRGFQIAVEDDLVRGLPEGQDMRVELSDLAYDQPIKNEFASITADILVDGDFSVIENSTTNGVEIKLVY